MSENNSTFFNTVLKLAVPVALQSMLQSSFSLIDQIMIGQLGSTSIAGVGFAGKFSSIYNVVIAAIGAVAGIMISQYIGQKNRKEIRRSFVLNSSIGVVIAVPFFVLCVMAPNKIMGLYTLDAPTRSVASEYLMIISLTFLPVALATMLSTLFRCMENATLPLIASIVATLVNTGLNYIFIFGKIGFKPMGSKGVALATVIAQIVNLLIMFIAFIKCDKPFGKDDKSEFFGEGFGIRQYACILMPMLICEFMWSVGENAYAIIYGRIGTKAGAAMTLINPVQGLMIGALCGLSQAASIIIGKKLGNKDYDEAYSASKKFMLYGLIGSVILSTVILVISPLYVNIYNVEEEVKMMTKHVLIAYAVIAPFKVENMILGGGILRSGGETKYVMIVDLLGTWLVGVPAGFLAAFIMKLPIHYVYFILSLEECVRFIISCLFFIKKKWMVTLE